MTNTELEQTEREILEEALISPRAALMKLSLEIERELRKLLVSTGALKRYMELVSPTVRDALKILSSVSGAEVPEELHQKVIEFSSLRNRVAHYKSEVPLAAFDLGLAILRILRSVPRPSYVIKKANLILYSDKHCQNPRPDVRGIMLETFGADGKSQGVRIYPSKREYVEGTSVGWEWDVDVYSIPKKGWAETWYKDPETGRCTEAWGASLEFIGRDLNEI
jgi:hypothetical protein